MKHAAEVVLVLLLIALGAFYIDQFSTWPWVAGWVALVAVVLLINASINRSDKGNQ